MASLPNLRTFPIFAPMESVRFYKKGKEHSIELTVNNVRASGRLFTGDLIGISPKTITYRFSLTKSEYEKRQRQAQIIHSVLMSHGLIDVRENQYHLGSLLLICIEFDNKHKDLKRSQDVNERLARHIEFIRLVKHLTPLEKQKVKVTFEIKGKPIIFENDPGTSEILVNKLSGVMMNIICNVYPELWKAHLKRGVKTKAANNLVSQAQSILQNKAVADITTQLMEYLNDTSNKLKDPKAESGKTTLRRIQGSFIYDLLTELNLYKPRERKKAENGAKEVVYQGLAKLVKRS